MNLTIPADVGPQQLKSTNMAEPGPGETVYNPASTYVAGAQVISLTTHRKYQAAAAVAANRDPATDTIQPPVWVDIGPTNRYAAFDAVVSTRAVSTTGSMSWTLQVGYFSSIYIDDIDAGNLEITVKDAPGGNVIFHYDQNLNFSMPTNWYEYFFQPFKKRTEYSVSGIEPYNNAEVTITLTGGASISVGLIAVGQQYRLGTTEKRAKSKKIDYTRYKRDDFGNLKIVPGLGSRDMSAVVVFPVSQAPEVERVMELARGKVCVFTATDSPNYIGLRGVGIGSFNVSYDDPDYGFCTMTLDVTGVI